MANKNFNFDLYRLNIGADENDETRSPVTTDAAIGQILATMATTDCDMPVTARKSTSTWGLRQFETFILQESARTDIVHQVLLVKALEEQDGNTLTDAGLSASRSAIQPPLATSVNLYFWMQRHLIAVEHNATLLSGTAWRQAVRLISKQAAKKHGYNAFLVLEPVAEEGTLATLLATFTRVTRIKAKVRIPNPELTRFTKALYEQLRESRIHEYRQDMQNRHQGLNLEEGTLARATVGLAEEGYKDGDVTIVGVRKSQIETVVFGHTAARGAVRITKVEMRLLKPNDDALQVQSMIGSLLREINRIKPPDTHAHTK
jgi:hypothetical protein